MAAFTSVNTPDRWIGAASANPSSPAVRSNSRVSNSTRLHDATTPAPSSYSVRAATSPLVGSYASLPNHAINVQRPVLVHASLPPPILNRTSSKRETVNQRLDVCENSLRDCNAQSKARDNHLHQDHLSLRKAEEQHYAALESRIRGLEDQPRHSGLQCDSTRLNELDERIIDLEGPYGRIPKPIEFRLRTNSSEIEQLRGEFGLHQETCIGAASDERGMNDLSAEVSSLSERMNTFGDMPPSAYVADQLAILDQSWQARITEQLALQDRNFRTYVDEQLVVHNRKLDGRLDDLNVVLSSHVERSSRLESSMTTSFYEHVANSEAKLAERINDLERKLCSIAARTSDFEKASHSSPIDNRFAAFDTKYETMCQHIENVRSSITATAVLTNECDTKINDHSRAIKDLKDKQTSSGTLQMIHKRLSDVENVASPGMLDKKFNALVTQITEMREQLRSNLYDEARDAFDKLTGMQNEWSNSQAKKVEGLSSQVARLGQGLDGVRSGLRTNITRLEDIDKQLDEFQSDKRFDKLSSLLVRVDEREMGQERQILEFKDSAEAIRNDVRLYSERCQASGLDLTGRIDGHFPLLEEKLVRIRADIDMLKTQQQEATRQPHPTGLVEDIRRISRRICETELSDEDKCALTELHRLISERNNHTSCPRTPRSAASDVLTIAVGKGKESARDTSPHIGSPTFTGEPDTSASETSPFHDPNALFSQMRALVAAHKTAPERQSRVAELSNNNSDGLKRIPAEPRRSGRANLGQKNHGDYMDWREVYAWGKKRKRVD